MINKPSLGQKVRVLYEMAIIEATITSITYYSLHKYLGYSVSRAGSELAGCWIKDKFFNSKEEVCEFYCNLLKKQISEDIK